MAQDVENSGVNLDVNVISNNSKTLTIYITANQFNILQYMIILIFL